MEEAPTIQTRQQGGSATCRRGPQCAVFPVSGDIHEHVLSQLRNPPLELAETPTLGRSHTMGQTTAQCVCKMPLPALRENSLLETTTPAVVVMLRYHAHKPYSMMKSRSWHWPQIRHENLLPTYRFLVGTPNEEITKENDQHMAPQGGPSSHCGLV